MTGFIFVITGLTIFETFLTFISSMFAFVLSIAPCSVVRLSFTPSRDFFTSSNCAETSFLDLSAEINFADTSFTFVLILLTREFMFEKSIIVQLDALSWVFMLLRSVSVEAKTDSISFFCVPVAFDEVTFVLTAEIMFWLLTIASLTFAL